MSSETLREHAFSPMPQRKRSLVLSVALFAACGNTPEAQSRDDAATAPMGATDDDAATTSNEDGGTTVQPSEVDAIPAGDPSDSNDGSGATAAEAGGEGETPDGTADAMPALTTSMASSDAPPGTGAAANTAGAPPNVGGAPNANASVAGSLNRGGGPIAGSPNRGGAPNGNAGMPGDDANRRVGDLDCMEMLLASCPRTGPCIVEEREEVTLRCYEDGTRTEARMTTDLPENNYDWTTDVQVFGPDGDLCMSAHTVVFHEGESVQTEYVNADGETVATSSDSYDGMTETYYGECLATGDSVSGEGGSGSPSLLDASCTVGTCE